MMSLIDMKVANIRNIASQVNLYEFQPISDLVLPDNSPGAHIDVHLPNNMIRQYSLIETGSQLKSYSICVKKDPNSRGGSAYMFESLQKGQVVKIGGPRNNFELHEDADHTVLIAGGIGITPIWTMVQRLQLLKKSWGLYFACKNRHEAPFFDLLRILPEANFHFDSELDDAVLDIAQIVEDAPSRSHLYCCGPPAMLENFKIATANVPSMYVHTESFLSTSPKCADGGFRVQLQRSNKEIFVEPGKTILETLKAAGVEVPFSCEQGICGACETGVIAGIPDHRDSVLTKEERASGLTMMICCSGTKSEILVLDL